MSMKYEKGLLGLIIPKSTDASYKILTLQEIEMWRNTLSLQDLKESIRSSHLILESLHQSKVQPADRLAMLNIIGPTINFLCDTLMQIYKKNITLKKKTADLYRIILTLHVDLFNELKLTLENFNAQNAPLDTQLEVVYLSLQQSSKIILLSYEIYRKAPDYVWLETHLLYNLAKNRTKLTAAAEQSSDQKNNYRLKKIIDTYKTILLFALTNPIRYHRSDFIKLYYAVEGWAPLLNLELPNEKIALQNHLFKVDFAKDWPPHYTALDLSEDISPCYLGLDKVIEHLELLIDHQQFPQHHQHVHFTSQELSLSKHVLQILMHTWQQFSHRQSLRKRVEGSATLMIGLASIAQYAAQSHLEKNAILEELPETEQRNVEEINLDALPLPQYAKDHTVDTREPVEGHIVDKSEGGYCFKCKGQQLNRLQSGEIIGILIGDGDQSVFELGIIRWVQVTDFDYAMIGIELLSLKCAAVQVKTQQQTSGSAVDGLLIKSIQSPQTNLLITPILRFRAQEQVVVQHQEQQYSCLLLDNLSITPGYGIWETTFLDAEPDLLNPTTQDAPQPNPLHH